MTVSKDCLYVNRIVRDTLPPRLKACSLCESRAATQSVNEAPVSCDMQMIRSASRSSWWVVHKAREHKHRQVPVWMTAM